MTETPVATTNWIGALDLAPNIAGWVGYYTAQIAGFEAMLNFYLTKLARLQDDAASQVIFGHIISISARIKILQALAARSEHAALQPRLSEMLSEAKGINAKRNEYIHGAYVVNDGTKEVTLKTWAFSPENKSKDIPISEAILESEVKRIQKFMSASAALLGVEIVR